MASDTDSSIQLAPPGAGLPLIELQISRLGFAMARRLMSRKSASAKFRREADLMLKQARALDPKLATKQVLIERVRGIEDSSRNWSLLMTLDHLVIVDTAIAMIVDHLVQEKPLSTRVSTAEVKPRPDQTMATVELFRSTTKQYLDGIERLPRLNSRARHEHPWFGPLNAHGWHCLAAIHHSIHRRQIERIVVISMNPDSLIL
jgi:hypothetical protein